MSEEMLIWEQLAFLRKKCNEGSIVTFVLDTMVISGNVAVCIKYGENWQAKFVRHRQRLNELILAIHRDKMAAKAAKFIPHT
ncbi:hypothetical protein X880_786 [Burkholderia pseudomallei MSHR4032]|nr:hypothetical protein X880_786 [Burkholderia pseudomallei MSHR4032]